MNSSLLHQLENNEAILLMYLANELPAQDRAEVEHMLDRDDSLRLELAEIQHAYTGAHALMRQSDAMIPPTSSFAAAHSIGDVIRSRQPEPVSVDDVEDRRRIHWAVYPISAAAVLLIGMFLWWRSAEADMERPQVMVSGDYQQDRERRWADMNGMNVADMQDFQILRMFDAVVPDRGSEAQRQLSAINFLDQSLQ